MDNRKNKITGSLGMNRNSMGIYTSIPIFLICLFQLLDEINFAYNNTTISSIISKPPFLLISISLLWFSLSIFFCATSNYSIAFLADSLMTRSYFTHKTKLYHYNTISKVSLNGAILSEGQKYFGIEMEIQYMFEHTKKTDKYTLKNFDDDDLYLLIRKIKKANINFGHNPEFW